MHDVQPEAFRRCAAPLPILLIVFVSYRTNPTPSPNPSPNPSPSPNPLQVFAEKQLKELKNGRLAMIAVLGELMAQQVSGYGTYEQLGLIVKSLPLPL